MKILFVCTGNICRSPMAEVIFRNLCSSRGRGDVYISGAGTSAINGMPMTPEAHEALRICGEHINHDMKAKSFHPNMIQEFDVIIVMAAHHAKIIGACQGHVKTLDYYTGCGDIFDPFMYPLETYIEVCKVLQNALGILYNKLF